MCVSCDALHLPISSSVEFKERCIIRISPKARQFSRVIKRHGIKFEVVQEGGFWRSGKPLGSCELKLVDLESKATIHQSLELMEGRRACGGKVEVIEVLLCSTCCTATCFRFVCAFASHWFLVLHSLPLRNGSSLITSFKIHVTPRWGNLRTLRFRNRGRQRNCRRQRRHSGDGRGGLRRMY